MWFVFLVLLLRFFTCLDLVAKKCFCWWLQTSTGKTRNPNPKRRIISAPTGWSDPPIDIFVFITPCFWWHSMQHWVAMKKWSSVRGHPKTASSGLVFCAKPNRHTFPNGRMSSLRSTFWHISLSWVVAEQVHLLPPAFLDFLLSHFLKLICCLPKVLCISARLGPESTFALLPSVCHTSKRDSQRANIFFDLSVGATSIFIFDKHPKPSQSQ